MKHYPHHIGDFDKATRHLNRIERSVYRDLIDLYYDTEERLTLDMSVLCRKIIARSNEEVTAVEQVLNEFFTETETGWYQERCELEIEAYRNNSSQKAQAGKASAEAKRLKKLHALNGNSTQAQQPLNSVATKDNGTSTNQEPITKNHKPINKHTQSSTSTESVCVSFPDSEFFDEARQSESQPPLPPPPLQQERPPPPQSMTRAGELCKKMKGLELQGCNPGHKDFIDLLAAGATDNEFLGAAAQAVERGKPFVYAVGIVKKSRLEAAENAGRYHRGAMPQKPKNKEPPWVTENRRRMQEAVPGIAEKTPQLGGEIIDMEDGNAKRIMG